MDSHRSGVRSGRSQDRGRSACSPPGGQTPTPGSKGPPARAFEEVLAEHLDALFRTALRLCRGHEAEAEDLLQETALRAFNAYGGLREPSAARSWLFTILG